MSQSSQQQSLSLAIDNIDNLQNKDTVAQDDLLALYLDVFQVLFDKERGLLTQYKHSGTVDQLEHLVTNISRLQKLIAQSTLQQSTKDTLSQKIGATISPNLIEQFDQKKKLSNDLRQQIDSKLKPKPLANSVYIRSWGTNDEISTGFKNVLRQQLDGEGVGHVSAAMRVAADEKGSALVEKYCLDDEGQVVIPYELKQIGNELIYEIYWSYWPNIMHTLKDDLKVEHSGVEYKSDAKLFKDMPLELKTRYLDKKQTKTKSMPIIGTMRDSNDIQIFENEGIKNSRTMALAPAAQFSMENIEPDYYKRQYLNYKIKYFDLIQKQSDIKLIQSNYFNTGKKFDLNQLDDNPKEIRSNSNLLTLIERFHQEFDDNSISAEILSSYTITRGQAERLQDQISKLEDILKNQITATENELINTAKLFDAKQSEVVALKMDITDAFYKINKETYQINRLLTAINVLEQVELQGIEGVDVHDEQLEYFKQYKDQVDISDLLETKFLTKERAQELEPFFRSLRKNISEKTRDEKKAIKKTGNVIKKALKSVKVMKISDADIKKLKLVSNHVPMNDVFRTGMIKSDRANTLISRLNTEVNKRKSYMSKDSETYKINTKKIEAIYQSQLESQQDYLEHQLRVNASTDKINMAQADLIRLHDLEAQHSEGRIEFNYTDINGQLKTVNFQSKQDFKHLKLHLEGQISSLRAQRLEAQNELINLQYKSSLSVDELEYNQLKLGNSNDCLMHDFNIEEMLKAARGISTTTFNLSGENCSTTTMKLLHAGAPEQVKDLFQWHQLQEGDEYASNVFNTNPQSVYSASKLLEESQNGNLTATKMIASRISSDGSSNYNAMLNELVTSFLLRNEENPGQMPQITASTIFHFIPHLFKLIGDLFFKTTVNTSKPNDSFHAKVVNELLALNDNKYLLISDQNPSCAIYQMALLLRSGQQNIPHFDSDTLSRVEQLILEIQVFPKQHRTAAEQQILDNYKAIIEERDQRLDTLEKTIVSGKDVVKELKNRKVNYHKLNWKLSAEDATEALVNHFIQNYQTLRNQTLFFTRPFRSNFSSSLNSIEGMSDKLDAIIEHIKQNPDSRSAQALADCISDLPQLGKCVSTEIKQQLPPAHQHLAKVDKPEEVHDEIENSNNLNFSV